MWIYTLILENVFNLHNKIDEDDDDDDDDDD